MKHGNTLNRVFQCKGAFTLDFQLHSQTVADSILMWMCTNVNTREDISHCDFLPWFSHPPDVPNLFAIIFSKQYLFYNILHFTILTFPPHNSEFTSHNWHFSPFRVYMRKNLNCEIKSRNCFFIPWQKWFIRTINCCCMVQICEDVFRFI